GEYGRLTPKDDSPLGLDTVAYEEQNAKGGCFVPPAEPRARDDPGLLVEPLAFVHRRRATGRRQPSAQPPRASRQRDLAQRLLGGEIPRSEEHTSELQSRRDLVCRLLLEKKK